MKEVGFEARFIELAGHVNGAMPQYVVQKVADALNTHSKSVRGASVLVLGVAYKRDIDDVRESPALDVMVELVKKGARVSYHDPYVPRSITTPSSATPRSSSTRATRSNAARRTCSNWALLGTDAGQCSGGPRGGHEPHRKA
jgi:UDP-N-acetyl-D-glucosamine dehydrogenase